MTIPTVNFNCPHLLIRGGRASPQAFPALTPSPSPKLGRGEPEGSGVETNMARLGVLVPLLPSVGEGVRG